MFNLLIALGAGVAAFLLGRLSGRWIYGIAPAVLVAPVVYVLLARRVGHKLEAIFTAAVKELQDRRIERARALLQSARPLARWQFLVGQQIDAQLGSIEYLQRRYDAARPLLAGTWKRNWQAQAMVAAIDLRKGRHEGAIARLEKTRAFARKEPVMWAMCAHALLESGRRDDALRTVAEGLELLPDSRPLKDLQQAIANDRTRKFRWGRVFGDSWYMFHPEDVPRRRMEAAARGRTGRTWPQPRR